MIAPSFRKAARVAGLIAASLLFVVVVIATILLFAAPPSAQTKQDLVVAQVVAASLGAISAASGALLARSQVRSRDVLLSDMLTPQLLDDERLINRTIEMRDLVACIDDSRAVGCHGPRGAGKSFLLEHLADVINGHRSKSAGQPRPKRVAAALYFDLADAVGFPEAQAQICGAVLGDPAATWSDFALSVKRKFKRQRVVLILDNVNSEGIWRQLGQAGHRYCAVRPQDRIVFGSIDKVVLTNLPVAQVEILGLDLGATEKLISTRGVSLSHEELVTFHDEWQGLPFYTGFLVSQDPADHSKRLPAAGDHSVIPDLPPATRNLVAYAALLALVTRRISFAELRGSGVADLDRQIEVAISRTVLKRIPEEKDRRFKIHDIIRDDALRELDPEVEEAASVLFGRAYQRDEIEHAALFAMFADPEQLGAVRLDHLLDQVIRSAIRSKNYALIESLHARASQNSDVLRFISSDEKRADLFCFARASALAGLGRYEEAEEEMHASTVVRVRWQRDTTGSELQANLRFLQADLAHLLNRYDESAQMFEELGRWATTAGRDELHARCVWGQGHVLRHQGRDLELALSLLNHAADLAGGTKDLFTRAYAVCNANGIHILLGTVPDDQAERLAMVELEVAGGSSQNGYLLEVWKTQAQLAWWRGDLRAARETVDAAIERAMELNDRLLYNLYFERAEFERLSGSPGSAVEDYRTVLDFGTGNRDRNLISQALIGLVLAEMGDGQLHHHGTQDEARGSLLRARQIAVEADIQFTVKVAEQVLAMLETGAHRSAEVRLFLL
jgi:tetratricopeptide (TPR) repeat protein